MRALRLLTLAAAMVIIPAAAAHAQVSVYVGPSRRYITPAYHQTWVPARGGLISTGRDYLPAQPGWYGYSGWRAHRYWAERRGFYDHRWSHDRRW